MECKMPKKQFYLCILSLVVIIASSVVFAYDFTVISVSEETKRLRTILVENDFSLIDYVTINNDYIGTTTPKIDYFDGEESFQQYVTFLSTVPEDLTPEYMYYEILFLWFSGHTDHLDTLQSSLSIESIESMDIEWQRHFKLLFGALSLVKGEFNDAQNLLDPLKSEEGVGPVAQLLLSYMGRTLSVPALVNEPIPERENIDYVYFKFYEDLYDQMQEMVMNPYHEKSKKVLMVLNEGKPLIGAIAIGKNSGDDKRAIERLAVSDATGLMLIPDVPYEVKIPWQLINDKKINRESSFKNDTLAFETGDRFQAVYDPEKGLRYKIEKAHTKSLDGLSLHIVQGRREAFIPIETYEGIIDIETVDLKATTVLDTDVLEQNIERGMFRVSLESEHYTNGFFSNALSKQFEHK